MNSNLETGTRGEDAAVAKLTSDGLEVLDRNWRGVRGELDIVARDGSALVAIEVKTRTSLNFGSPAAAITSQKIERLRRLFGQWIVEHRQGLPRFNELRIDVVSVLLPRSANGANLSNTTPPQVMVIEHLRGVS